MEKIFDFIANVSAIATLVGFVFGFVWNYQSNKQAKRANLKMCKKFAENLVNVRKIEIERINAEIDKLQLEVNAIETIRKLKVNNAKQEDKETISLSYTTYITSLSVTIEKLKQLATQISLDAVLDVDTFMKDISDR